MLANPEWEVKTAPLSLENLIVWLEQQPPDREYPVTEAAHCLLAQWLRSMDPKADTCEQGPHSFWYDFKGAPANLEMFRPVILGDDGKRTFGAALERARTLHLRHQP